MITIAHTRADGTLVHGTAKGDGSAPILKSHRFRWFRTLGCWGVPQSRDKMAKHYIINQAAEALRAAGFDVEITINEDERRSFAEAEAERHERAEGRADRYSDLAERTAVEADALSNRAHDMATAIPLGQPILVGHHSERRDRNYRDRIWATQGRAVAAADRAEYFAGRADAAEHFTAHRNNPGRTLRRIDKLEAELRGFQRSLAIYKVHGTLDTDNGKECQRRIEEHEEQLTYWRTLIAQAEADGVKIWSREDFKVGDFVQSRGRLLEVLRVNPKSLTVPSCGGARIVTDATRAYSWNDKVPYNEVSGRKSAEEMAELFAQAEQIKAERLEAEKATAGATA